VFHCRTRTFEPSIQLLVIAVGDLVGKEVYAVHLEPYVPRKVLDALRERRRSSEPRWRWHSPLRPCSGSTSTSPGWSWTGGA
jgi:hypothetical protein